MLRGDLQCLKFKDAIYVSGDTNFYIELACKQPVVDVTPPERTPPRSIRIDPTNNKLETHVIRRGEMRALS